MRSWLAEWWPAVAAFFGCSGAVGTVGKCIWNTSRKVSAIEQDISTLKDSDTRHEHRLGVIEERLNRGDANFEQVRVHMAESTANQEWIKRTLTDLARDIRDLRAGPPRG